MKYSYLTLVKTFDTLILSKKKRAHAQTQTFHISLRNYYFNPDVFLDPSTAYIIHWYDNTCTTQLREHYPNYFIILCAYSQVPSPLNNFSICFLFVINICFPENRHTYFKHKSLFWSVFDFSKTRLSWLGLVQKITQSITTP